jgi:hypothetical protein
MCLSYVVELVLIKLAGLDTEGSNVRQTRVIRHKRVQQRRVETFHRDLHMCVQRRCHQGPHASAGQTQALLVDV